MSSGFSDLRGQLVHAVRDEYGSVEVFDHDNGERSLFFGSTVEQARVDRISGRPVFDYVRWQALAPALVQQADSSALILGLGGGVLARLLYQQYSALQLTGVELREAVVDLACEAFDLPVNHRLEVFVADAARFLQQTQEHWPVIVSDLFDAQGIAVQTDDTVFFESCAARLSPGGVFAVNLWRVNLKRYWRSLNQLAEVFDGQLLCADMDDANSVVYAFAPPFEPHSELLESARLGHRASELGLNLMKLQSFKAYRKK